MLKHRASNGLTTRWYCWLPDLAVKPARSTSRLLAAAKSFTIQHAQQHHRQSIERIANSFDLLWEADEDHERRDGVRFLTLVAEAGEQVTGFLCAWLVADEVQLVSLAVYPEHRRRGVATRLLRALRQSSRNEPGDTAFLEVSEDNQAALDFYQKLGFSVLGKRKGYYSTDDKVIDAVLMSCPVQDLATRKR